MLLAKANGLSAALPRLAEPKRTILGLSVPTRRALYPFVADSMLTASSNFNFKRRAVKGAVAALHHGTKVARRHDMLEGTAMSDESSNSSASDYDETPSPPADASVVYSFDAARSPSHGSQILNAALAQAVKKYEDRETVKLIKDEYEVLDDEGESIGVTPAKKGKKAKVHAEPAVVLMDADDGDWECI
ncbi:hypothetical protein BAUCODRAFT_37932 [Baudoinia panamericana UAMH 10762]|uniref:Uncharacterized protein n=1 Tax=Baudoinia panamericana (strain UAMH 10762) TaxID=717646 RepID=M2N215_BAUPA|nr:uncharacterized protein BAUCODRAFT_37932 [Baudoinia panamericana UAMH 10762]EMC93004.1 hypothetical protein BAUCODRAFT_37932 [Baudoinia panamericana UAMH 10762]